jgi:hypothetical protein
MRSRMLFTRSPYPPEREPTHDFMIAPDAQLRPRSNPLRTGRSSNISHRRRKTGITRVEWSRSQCKLLTEDETALQARPRIACETKVFEMDLPSITEAIAAAITLAVSSCI